MTKAMEFLKKQPLLTAIIANFFAVGGVKLLDHDGTGGLAVHRFILATAMCFFLYLISGEKTFVRCEKTTGYVFKSLSGILIFGAVMGALGIVTIIVNHSQFTNDWLLQIVLAFLAFLGVGLFEELAFRAVINDGFIYQFRDKKWVFAVSAVIGSLFFGFVHVMGEDISTIPAFLQVVMKTISTGIWGMCILVLYWKTRNIWACGLIHGIYDFSTQVWGFITVSEPKSGASSGYVREGADGVTAIVTYVIQAIVMLIIFLVLRKKILKTIDFEEIRKNW